MFIIKFLRLYWKSIAIAIIILYLSFAPPSTFKKIPTFEIVNLDKIVHFLMYASFTFILMFDFFRYNKNNINFRTFVYQCVIFPIIFGGIIEIMQSSFFAPRTGSWIDFMFNISGVLFGWLIIYFTKNKWIKV
ncbi:MAG: VanZ family protein [Paludibacter sp.]